MEREVTQKKNTMTRECIFTALLILMEQKPYAEITITDITKKAGVSRMSYYRLYDSKDDILEQHCHDIFKECLEQLKQEDGIDKHQFAVRILQVCQRYQVLIRGVIHARLHDLVQKNLLQYCAYLAEYIFHLDMQSQKTDYWIYMTTGKFSMLIIRWIERGMKESPEEVADLLTEELV